MAETTNSTRRRFLGAAIGTVAAARLGAEVFAAGQRDVKKPATSSGTNRGAQKSFGALKQINSGVLSVGYAEAGPAGGTPVLLLHGWPYDIYAFVDVAPLLASKVTE